MFPSMPSDGGRDPRPVGARPGQPGGTREPLGGSAPGVYGAGPSAEPGHTTGGRGVGHAMAGRGQAVREDPDPEEAVEPAVEIPVVPVRRQLCVAIAGFAGLLGIGLILGAQTSAPDARTPYAIVIFGVQLLFVLAWTMALRPPALPTVAVVAVVVAAAADAVAVSADSVGVLPLLAVAAGGYVLALAGQAVRPVDRARLKDSLGGTLLILLGVVALATLVVLTRKPSGTQTIVVCLTATGVALVVARLTDAVFARPRVAAQVPRGATGIIGGAMLGTLAAAGLGSVMVPFTPARGAIVGVAAAGAAGLVDLAVNYAEAGRSMAGEAPTLWVARHMQGPLGAFALAAAVAFVMAGLVVT